MILHTVNKSPSTHSALQSCLRLASAGSAILLLEDGVYGALSTAENTRLLPATIVAKHRFYVLEGDLQARGLSNKIRSDFEVISYHDFVILSLEYSKVQSWS